ncbi:MAG: cobalt-precorrin-5B (C(1))-methyltransferase [Lachnospira eligens]
MRCGYTTGTCACAAAAAAQMLLSGRKTDSKVMTPSGVSLLLMLKI